VPRRFTAKSAARVVCAALAGGASDRELLQELKDRCDFDCEDSDPECERKRQRAVQVAEQLIEGNNEILIVANGLMVVWVLALRVFLNIIARAAPVTAPVVQLVISQASRFQVRIAARRAANDELFQIVQTLRRAA